MKCKNCGCVFWNKDECMQDMTGITCFGYMKPKTNADRIREMSDEELAKWLCSRDNNCEYCPVVGTCSGGRERNELVDWLKNEVE